MSQQATIKLGEMNGYSCIRICGRGDVFLAPQLKALVDKILSSKTETAPKLVVDMEDCSGMDSTFMGTLASFAIKLKKIANSCFQLFGVNASNQESLEELGLDSLIEINPENPDLTDNWQTARSELSCWLPTTDAAPSNELILNTHKALIEINEKNKKEFSDVIETLEQ